MSNHDDDPTAPGRPPDPPGGRELQVLHELAASTRRIGGRLANLVGIMRTGKLPPAARLTLAAELREAGNNLRAAAVLLEGLPEPPT